MGKSPMTMIEVTAKNAKLLIKSVSTFVFHRTFSLRLKAMMRGIHESHTFPKTENTSLRLCISLENKIVVPDAKKLIKKKGIFRIYALAAGTRAARFAEVEPELRKLIDSFQMDL